MHTLGIGQRPPPPPPNISERERAGFTNLEGVFFRTLRPTYIYLPYSRLNDDYLFKCGPAHTWEIIFIQINGYFGLHNYSSPAPPPPHPPQNGKNFYRDQTWYKSSHDTPDGRPWGLPPVKKGFCQIQGGGSTPLKMAKTSPGETIGRTKICIKYDF